MLWLLVQAASDHMRYCAAVLEKGRQCRVVIVCRTSADVTLTVQIAVFDEIIVVVFKLQLSQYWSTARYTLMRM